MFSKESSWHRLAFLPQDILISILNYLSFMKLADLYLCGDRHFNNRLTKGEIVPKLKLDNNLPVSTSVIPQLVSVFDKLQEISIGSSKPYDKPLDLSLLPRTLRSLELAVSLWPAALFCDQKFHALLPAKTMWPQLHTFIANHRYDSEYPQKWVLQLPLTLTRLSVPSILYEDIPSLPEGLLDLSCTFDMREWPLEGHKLPNSLTAIDLYFTNLNAFVSYPPRLIRAEIKYSSRSHPDWNGFDPETRETEGFHFLPENLESLNTCIHGPISTQMVKVLPSTLTSLSLTENHPDAYGELDWVSHLPRNLTQLGGNLMNTSKKLRVVTNDEAKESQRNELKKVLCSLPRSLTELPFTSDVLSHIDLFKLIPPSVTELSVESVTKEGMDILKEFPLSGLSVSFEKSEQPITLTLPERVKRLVLRNSSHVSFVWPKFLTKVRLNFMADMSHVRHLPPTVIELTGALIGFENEPALQNLVRLQLLLLHLGGPKSGSYGNFLRSISPSLQVLAIVQQGPHPGATDLFHSISHLKSLRIIRVLHAASELNESDIESIPRSVLVLKISGGVNKFQDPARLVAAFPPKIRQIAFPGPHFDVPSHLIENLHYLESFVFDSTEHELLRARSKASHEKRQQHAQTIQKRFLSENSSQ